MAFKRDGAYEEQGKFIAWIFWTIVWAVLALYLLMLLMMPMQLWLREGFSILTLGSAMDFWKQAVSANMSYLIASYIKWFTAFGETASPHWSLYLPFTPFIAFFTILLVGIFTNPHDYMPKIFGGGRMAEYSDVKKMKLYDGFCIVLGRFKGKLLKMPETLSALVVAPPGTGKTVGVVIPTIFESPGLSIIVNDPKPELCYNTTGYRATQGPVFVINWGAEDDPEKGLYYPGWNPLSENCLPPLGKERDTYIESMVNVLVEEPKEIGRAHV